MEHVNNGISTKSQVLWCVLSLDMIHISMRVWLWQVAVCGARQRQCQCHMARGQDVNVDWSHDATYYEHKILISSGVLCFIPQCTTCLSYQDRWAKLACLGWFRIWDIKSHVHTLFLILKFSQSLIPNFTPNFQIRLWTRWTSELLIKSFLKEGSNPWYHLYAKEITNNSILYFSFNAVHIS